MTNTVLSLSITIAPIDARCRYWAKIIRADRADLPLPTDVHGATDIPGVFSPLGEEEIFVGDFLIEGEQRHHRKQRGWTYHLTYLAADGTKTRITPRVEYKQQLKTQGLEPKYLTGAGDLAAIVRIIHGLRLGFTIAQPE